MRTALFSSPSLRPVGGLNMEYLYITCFDKIYRMKTRTRGIVYQNGPQAYPPKKK